MGLVGAMRFATVVLGLVSLKHIAASFTETVKASAPFFTVVIAYLMLGERTSWEVVMSLVPVAGGLVMVSFSELSFNVIGFSAAVATNVIECVQNVFSKRLLARDYTPQQLQFYTSLTALALQAPMLLLSQGDEPAAPSASTVVPGLNGTLTASPSAAATSSSFVLTRNTIALLWVDGVLYHLQSVVAYVVMSHLSPVTVSVINTLKRALLIWISVLVFGNEVTHMAQLGTAICLLGTLGYNYWRQSPPRSK
jgi:solute carrier family 35 protein E2